MIFGLNRDSHIPLYNQIAIQVREMIIRGALKVGDRLPANRELAKSLGVNRSTVTTAYEELTADGLITSRIGSGTFVSAVPHSRAMEAEEVRRQPSPMPWSALLADQRRDEWLSGMIRTSALGKSLVSLDYALPAPELFPVDDFRRAVDRVLRREARGFLQLGTSDGYPPLLQYLVTHMKRAGVTLEPGEILITNGCQQSLDLIRQILVRPGEEVVLENPTYPGAISVFCSHQSKYISVPVGPCGLDLEILEDVLRQRRPKLIYTIPSFHNPTGITMDLTSRRRLIELAAFYRVPIIEDDIFGELRYDGVSLPPLKSLDEYGLVIYINSFSKVGFPGLRVGWVVAPPIVIEHLHAVKQRTDLHASLLSQAVISDFVRQGLLAKHIRRCRKEYAQRRDAMLFALSRHFPSEAVWNQPEGGMSIWVRLPEALNARQVLMQAIEQGVSFSPGEFFYSCTPRLNMLRLSFTMVNPSAIEDAVKRLGAVIKSRLASAKKRPEFQFRATAKPLM
jgi:DNA-binding transcriptional MocR family regulator